MFARIESGLALDPIPALDRESVKEFFHADYITSRGGIDSWISVPEGTQHGASDNGNGTYKNPEPPGLTPKVLTKPAFNKHGWTLVGMARHQEILEAAKNRPGSEELDLQVRAVYRQFLDADEFEKADATGLAQILVAAGIMSADESALYLDNWPEA